MAQGLFIIGTDTDVGKTFVTAGIVYILKKNGLDVCSFKPVQSGALIKCNAIISQDIAFVKSIADIEDDEALLSGYCFKAAVSPHLAAEIEDNVVQPEHITEKYAALTQKHDFVIVEGSGGIAVPLNRSGYFVYDLIKQLNLPCLLVARAGVGTINHTILTVEFARSKGININGIIVNEYQGQFYEDDNIQIIKNITGVDILATISKIKADNNNLHAHLADIRAEYDKSLDVTSILECLKA